jgi:hypothetical protein
MKLRIKRCPFCGDFPVMKTHAESYIIECLNQLCEIQPCAVGDTEAQTAQKWNRRAQ